MLKHVLRKPLTIWQWAALLVTSCILPAILATALLSYFSYERERQNVEHAAIEVARALMQAIDREFSSAEGMLEALATSPYLESGNLEAFYRQAIESLKHRAGNHIIVSDASGRQLLNTALPFGTALPMHSDAPRVRRVFETGRPMVSDLYAGRVVRQLVTSVHVPVVVGGRVHYALSMQYRPDRLGQLLTEQRIAAGWVAAALDSAGIVVARTREPERFIGQPATPGVIRAMGRAREGSLWDRTLEGIPSVAVFSRSAVSDWTVVIGMHRAVLTQSLRTSVAWTIGGALLLLTLGLALALLVGSRIAASVRALVAPAAALGYGKPVTVPPLRLREAQEVGFALLQAEHLLRERTCERDQAERKERELREAKRQVEQSEAFLRGVFEETPDAVFLVAPDGHIVRANAEAEYLFGHRADHFSALKIDDLLFDEQAPVPRDLVTALFATPARKAIREGVPLRGVRSDGSIYPVEVRVSPMHAQEGTLAIVTVRDVTRRERSEQALRESERRFRNTIENAPIGIAIVALDGHLMEVNSAACEIVGYSQQQLLGMRVQELTHPDDLPAELAYQEQLLRGEIRSFQIEKRYLRKDGRSVPVLLTATLQRDDRGNPAHFIGQIQDISERKRAESELIALNERLDLATRAGGIGVWDWNIVTGELVWDERMHALYQAPLDAATREFGMWVEHIHPEDLPRAEMEYREALARGRDYASEFRIVWPGGEVRTIQANAIITRNENGQPLRMTGTNIDVTESRRRAAAIHAALHEKEMLLKELYHRVKNNLQVIASLLNLQIGGLPDGVGRTALADSANRVRAMALVHEKLYQSGNLSSIELDAYVQDLCMQLDRVADAKQRGIEIAVEVEPLSVELDIAIPLGLVLNELVMNSLKHAFPGNRGGRILVRGASTGDGNVRVEVADDGIGLPEGANEPTFSQTLGLKLVVALSKQMGAAFSLESRKGTRASLVFPLPASAERIKQGTG